MNLIVDIEKSEEHSTLTLSGEIDIYTAPKIREHLLPLTKYENYLIILDLKEVNYMDSTGLGVFIQAVKAAKRNNSRIRLVRLQKRVARLFTITGLDEIIDIEQAMGME